MGKGGGNDGGVIATKRYLIKSKKVDTNAKDRERSILRARVCTCALTGERLAPNTPVVADDLGNLFAKAAVLEYVLSKREIPAFSHIKLFKRDVFPVKLTFTDESETVGAEAERTFICPITLVEANGSTPFVALRGCGCVLSERALKEVGRGACPVCNADVSVDDCVRVYPTDEERDFLLQRLKARRAAAKEAKDKAAADGSAKDKRTADAPDAVAGAASRAGDRVRAAAGDAADGHHSGGEAVAAARASHGAEIRNAETAPRAGMKRPAPEGDDALRSHGRSAVHNGSAHGAPVKHAATSGGRHVPEEIAVSSAPAAVAEAERRIADQRAQSRVYASLFNSSRTTPSADEAARRGAATGKAVEDLFIRTATSVFTKNREY